MTSAKLGLFEGPAPRLRAVPASAPFLDLLAEALIEALVKPDDPFALSDALILLPNKRSRAGLIDAFAARLGGSALLPTIRAVGDPDIDEDADVWGADPIGFEILPAIDATRRRLELAALIRARDAAAGGVEDPARAIALADELRRLLDSAAAADEVHWDRLPKLADEVDLARHWEASAAFLDIVATYWPQRLAADKLTDPGTRRSALLKALAKQWQETPPTRPVVIAGSTGSIGATRVLMGAIAGLPRGVVVLPGLDVDLDAESWNAIGDQHPQFALKETLATLGVERDQVKLLGAEQPQGRARRVLMREALAPAEKTADWLVRVAEAGGKDFVEAGARGVALLEASTEDEEAAAIALLLREALETKGRTAALATPDVALARRVEAKLARWGVQPVVSHGRPLRETAAGSLIALLCELADDADPVAIAALLKHPNAAFGLLSERLAQARAALEHEVLRGPRRFADLAELQALTESSKAKDLAGRLLEALAPLRLIGEVTVSQFAEAVVEAAERIAPAHTLWRNVDGEAAANFLVECTAHGAELGAMPAHSAPRALMKLMESREIPPPPGGDPRIAIWGPLEARLQRRDLMILGGLNEGAWPAPVPQDPFLSRAMRDKLGLPSLDMRLGLAAHDFAQLANAPDVVLTRSLRRENAPTLASRWLWRLETLARGAGAPLARAKAPIAWARALDAPATSVRTPRIPKPRPPASARLKRISVTQVELLIRDPYAVYARRILGLESLKPLGALASYAERGIAIHKAIERFDDGEDPARLAALLEEELRRAGFPPERLAAERARLQPSVSAFLAYAATRRDAQAFLEKRGELALSVGATLSAAADRIEIDAEGATIIDFKTGSVRTDRQVESGLAPQLPLEAAMLARGAFKDVPAARVQSLVYWKLGNAEPKLKPLKLEAGAYESGEAALTALEKLLQRYALEEQAFLSKPRVQFLNRWDDYDHLARRKEWADADGDEL